MNYARLVIVAWSLSGAMLFAAPADSLTNELPRLQGVYATAVAAIDVKYQALLTNAPTQYLQGLDTLEKSYQQKGEFKSVMAVRAERERVKPEAFALGPDSDTDPKELKEYRAKARPLPAQYSEQKSKELEALASSYLTRLEALQRDLTKAGRIAMAADVQVEMDKVKVMRDQPTTIITIEAKSLPPVSDPMKSTFPTVQSEPQALPDSGQAPAGITRDTPAWVPNNQIKAQLPSLSKSLRPAEIEVSGTGYTVAQFKNGVTAFSNRGYTWVNVPRVLEGFLFTQTTGNGAAEISIKALSEGYIYAATAAPQVLLDEKGQSWTEESDLNFSYNAGSPVMHVFRLKVKSGEALSIKQAHSFTGTIVLFPSSQNNPVLAEVKRHNAPEPPKVGLQGKVYGSVKEAFDAARKEQKPLFIAVYTKQTADPLKLAWMLRGLIGWDATKKLIDDNFIQAILDKNDIADLKQVSFPNPFEYVLVYFLSPSGDLFHTERITYNAETGYDRMKLILKKWQERNPNLSSATNAVPVSDLVPIKLSNNVSKLQFKAHSKASSIIEDAIYPTGTKTKDGIVLTQGSLSSSKNYKPPVKITYIARTDSTNIRLGYAAKEIIFNWEINKDTLYVGGGPANGQNRPGKGAIPINEFVTIEQEVRPDKMIIRVDGKERASWDANFNNINEPVRIFTAQGAMMTVKDILVE